MVGSGATVCAAAAAASPVGERIETDGNFLVGDLSAATAGGGGTDTSNGAGVLMARRWRPESSACFISRLDPNPLEWWGWDEVERGIPAALSPPTPPLVEGGGGEGDGPRAAGETREVVPAAPAVVVVVVAVTAGAAAGVEVGECPAMS